ncbi:MAG: hypothetical protein KatS3mg129_0764 [Leptospiraceae bacterium]|nr:MAG: hypothetical protein KatS3mg129_0764 [Leptospiraceae bacterium]
MKLKKSMKKISGNLLSNFRKLPMLRLVDNHPDCPGAAFMQCLFLYMLSFIKKIYLFLIITISLNTIYSQEQFFRILPGYGLYGSGNIINSSGQGLELIETGINSGYLYSPYWSPLNRRIWSYL